MEKSAGRQKDPWEARCNRMARQHFHRRKDIIERIKRKEAGEMTDKKHILTYAGLKQYEDELQNLKVVKRKEVAQKIKEAREQGDLSENA